MVFNKTGSAQAIAEVAGQTVSLIVVGNQYGGSGDDLLLWGASAGADQVADGVKMQIQGAGKVDLGGKTEAMSTNSSWLLNGYSSYSTSAQIVNGTINTGTTVQQIRLEPTATASYWGTPATVAANLTMGAAGGLYFEILDGFHKDDGRITGTITGSGTNTVIKNETGALWMTNASNAFVGSLYINNGVLVVSNPAQLGNATNPIIFNNFDNGRQQASLRAEFPGGSVPQAGWTYMADGVTRQETIPNPITLQSTNSAFNAAIIGREALNFTGTVTTNVTAGNNFRFRFANYAPTTFAGQMTYSATNTFLIVDNFFISPVTISGTITDMGNDGLGGNYNHFYKDGMGTLTLSGTNTYEGATTINNGILRVTSNGALGKSGIPTSFTQITAGGRAGSVGQWAGHSGRLPHRRYRLPRLVGQRDRHPERCDPHA